MKAKKKSRQKRETLYKLPLVLDPQPEGGYTVTCPLLPELITEGDTAQEALSNVADALAALLEAYQTLGRRVPPAIKQSLRAAPLWLETVVAVP
jgi:antitoxin HicB